MYTWSVEVADSGGVSPGELGDQPVDRHHPPRVDGQQTQHRAASVRRSDTGDLSRWPSPDQAPARGCRPAPSRRSGPCWCSVPMRDGRPPRWGMSTGQRVAEATLGCPAVLTETRSQDGDTRGTGAAAPVDRQPFRHPAAQRTSTTASTAARAPAARPPPSSRRRSCRRRSSVRRSPATRALGRWAEGRRPRSPTVRPADPRVGTPPPPSHRRRTPRAPPGARRRALAAGSGPARPGLGGQRRAVDPDGIGVQPPKGLDRLGVVYRWPGPQIEQRGDVEGHHATRCPTRLSAGPRADARRG